MQLAGRGWVCLVIMMAVSAGSAADHLYEIQLDSGLSEVQVVARLAPGTDRLSARNGDTAKLKNVTGCGGQALRTRREKIIVPDGESCVSYSYPLKQSRDRWVANLSEDVVVSTPSAWLWLPSRDEAQAVRVMFSMPPGFDVSVPWQAVGDGVYEVPPSPRSSRGLAVFGNFHRSEIELPGSSIQVALIDGRGSVLDVRKTLTWLATAAGDIAMVGGEFPNPSLQVIVQPSQRNSRWGGSSRSAVPFGYVIRDGGEAVHFLVDGEKELDDYLGDWTATHEFSHLLLPYIQSSQKWISEGFASYYQNVLLARRGVYTPNEAWWRLYRSFMRAERIVRPPALNDLNRRSFSEVRMLIYWSGAALALMADVKLRRLSDGSVSLDTVLAELADCCLPSERSWQGRELFEKLDTLSPYPVFVELYDAHAEERGMPDFQSLYEELGIVPGDGSVTLLDDAAGVIAREQIMARWQTDL